MGNFGDRLQREREMRSITLEEIAESTKIGSRMLRALEQEDFCKLPGGIFNKGFVRAYARYLGIDEEQAVSDYVAAMAESQRKDEAARADQEMMQSLAVMADNERVQRAEESGQSHGFLKAALILVAGIAAIVFIAKFANGRDIDLPVTERSTVSEPTVQAAAPQTHPDPTPQLTVTGADPAGKQSANEPQKLLTAAPAKSIPEPKQETKTASAIESAKPEDAALSASDRFTLNIKAKEDSWIQIKADGKTLMEGELSASSSRSFRAQKELVVKLGNAAGVQISHNGKQLPAFSSDTRTKTLTFSPAGLSANPQNTVQ